MDRFDDILAEGQGFRCTIARGSRARQSAEALCNKVYSRRLDLPPAASDGRLETAEALVLQVCQADQTVATMTLQGPALTGCQPDGLSESARLELENCYDLDAWGLERPNVVEVRRVAAATRDPGAVNCLLGGASELSRRCGVEHWLGLVEAHGARAVDAGVVHVLLEAHGVLATPLPLPPRGVDPLFESASREGQPAVDLALLRRVPLPHRIRYFAERLHARAVSVPTLHPHYPRLVVPMFAQVAKFQHNFLPMAVSA